MKHRLMTTCLMALFAVPAGAQEFTLTGQFTGESTPFIYLRYSDSKGRSVLDSTAIGPNGAFAFKGQINGPVQASLYGKLTSRRMDDPNYYYFFLEPGRLTAQVTENAFAKTHVQGAQMQAEMDALKKRKAPIEEKWQPFFRKLDSVGKIDNFKAQEMKDGLAPYYAEMKQIDFAYIDAHPASHLTAYLLGNYSRDLSAEKLTAYYNRLLPAAKQAFGKRLEEELERKRIGVPGTMAPDFSATDINSQPLKLSDYRGQYVLLDFWASWCLPCRKGNPHLKTLYSKYKEKGLEIIAVSDNDSKPDAWRKAVDQDGTGIWKHVLRGLDWEKLRTGVPNEKDISKKYGIYSLPTKVLIDQQGKVIGRFEGGDKDDAKMDAQLKNIFGQ